MTTLVHIADVHFGCEDKEALAAVKAALPEFEDPIVVVAGDLTLNGRRHEFEAAAAWLSGLGRPVFMTQGNHDVPTFNPVARFLTPFTDFGRAFADHPDQHLFRDDFALLSLNTARGFQFRFNWAHGAISREQAWQAVRDLTPAPQGAIRTVVCHHPLVVPPGAPIKTRTRGGPEAAEIMANGGVDVVLTGHLHRPFAIRLPQGDGKTWSVGAGTLSQRQRGDPASFTVLKRENGALSVSPWRVENGRAAPSPPMLAPLRAR